MKILITVDDWALSSNLGLNSLAVDDFETSYGIVEDKSALFAAVKDDAVHLESL